VWNDLFYAAGLKGIEENLECPPSFEGTMRELLKLGQTGIEKFGARASISFHIS